MTKMTPLLQRNEQFARTYTPVALGLPAAQVIIVTCLDHRVDPAAVLGLQLGDAPVIRNAGGRVTQAVIDDLAYLAFLAEQLSGGQGAQDGLVEVAVIHHTQCGTGLLADPGFRHQAAASTGLAETALEASAVADPHITVKDRRRAPDRRTPSDGERLRPRLRHRHRTRHHHPRAPTATAAGRAPVRRQCDRVGLSTPVSTSTCSTYTAAESRARTGAREAGRGA